jgi:Tol biopolymer transport system component
MSDPVAGRERLDSWKQIAAYLNKSERTVRRWQETENLPVYKHQHQQRGSVWAYPEELRAWLAARTLQPESGDNPSLAPRQNRIWLAALIAVTVGLLFVLFRPSTPVPNPEPIPLTALPGSEYGPTFSPDGKRFAFHWNQPQGSGMGIFTKELGSNKVTPIAVEQGRIAFLYSPAWSPDGASIAFLERTPAGDTWLCLAPSSGGERRRVKQIAAPPTLYFGNYNHIAWNRDSRTIIVPTSLGSEQGIYRVSVDSGAAVAITNEKAVYSPALSPDGRKLVSLRHEGLPITSESILLYDLKPDGSASGSAQLIYKGAPSSGITWLADSQNLVMCKSGPTMVGPLDGHLFKFAAVAGSRMQDIGGEGCSTVSRAPDGSVVYAARLNPRSRMLRASLQSMNPGAEFLPSSRYDSFPSFSPEGKHVAFYSNRSGEPGIWVARADGTELRLVSEGARVHSAAAWSPDSKQVVFVAGDALAVSDLSGGRPYRLDLGGSIAQHPIWSPDGGIIFYTANSHLWRVRPDGTGREALRELPPILELHASPDGRHLYYSRPGKPITLCRIPLNGEPEEIVQADAALPAFAVGTDSLFYIGRDNRVHSRALAGGRDEIIGPVLVDYTSGARQWDLRLSISPDASTIIWVVSAPQEIDIALQKLAPIHPNEH